MKWFSDSAFVLYGVRFAVVLGVVCRPLMWFTAGFLLAMLEAPIDHARKKMTEAGQNSQPGEDPRKGPQA